METEKKFIGFHCPAELVELVDEHADRERRSRSNMMIRIIETWLMDRARANTLVDSRVPYTVEDPSY